MLAGLVLTGSLMASADAPVRYNAITDGLPRPEPPLPAFGGAGSVITDPVFGTHILRVTDANTQPDYPGAAFMTPGGSFENNWNADTTMFWLWGKGGMVVYRFDAASFRATPVPDPKNAAMPLVLPFGGGGPFSYRRPNILYLTRGLSVVEYDFNTNTQAPVFEAGAAVPGVGGDAYTPSVSDDDSRICLAFGAHQDTHPYVAVLDRNSGRYQVLDTVNSKLNGQPATISLGFGIHSAYMDRSGRYVILSKGQGKQPGQSEWVVWDVDTSRVYEIKAEWSGHDASGFGVRVNQSGFFGGQPAFYDEQQWAVRGLSEDAINDYKYLLDWHNLPTPHNPIASGHHSWNNARPDVAVPVVGSIVRDARQTDVPWRAWDNEVIGIATDGSGAVYRFAHHRAVWDRSEFWDDPRGNISQNGRFFMFTSNWGRSVGAGRRDVFIVELPADGAPAPQAAQPQPEPAPAPAPEVQPDPAPAPEVQPDPAPAPDPEPAPVVQPAPAPPSEPAPQPAPEPQPAPQPEPAPAPAPAGRVWLLAPVNGQRLPSQVFVVAIGSTPELTNVEFIVNDQTIAKSPSLPFTVQWEVPGPGTYTFKVRATDGAGNVVEDSVTASH